MVAVTGGKAGCLVKWLSPHEIWLMLFSEWEGGASKSLHVPAPGSPPCSARSAALAKDCHHSETRVCSLGVLAGADAGQGPHRQVGHREQWGGPAGRRLRSVT